MENRARICKYDHASPSDIIKEIFLLESIFLVIIACKFFLCINSRQKISLLEKKNTTRTRITMTPVTTTVKKKPEMMTWLMISKRKESTY
jgi:hypothetical protein